MHRKRLDRGFGLLSVIGAGGIGVLLCLAPGCGKSTANVTSQSLTTGDNTVLDDTLPAEPRTAGVNFWGRWGDQILLELYPNFTPKSYVDLTYRCDDDPTAIKATTNFHNSTQINVSIDTPEGVNEHTCWLGMTNPDGGTTWSMSVKIPSILDVVSQANPGGTPVIPANPGITRGTYLGLDGSGRHELQFTGRFASFGNRLIVSCAGGDINLPSLTVDTATELRFKMGTSASDRRCQFAVQSGAIRTTWQIAPILVPAS
jgi:hypothetical protein